MTIWLCRAGLEGQYEDKFIDLNKIFLIGNVSIDLTGKTDMQELMKLVAAKYPTEPDGSVITMSTQARAFATKAKVGDWVVLPSLYGERLINIGEITGKYEYDGSKSELKHSHTVDWKYGAWKRDQFDLSIIRSVDAFDSFMMFFRLRMEQRIKEIVGKAKPFTVVESRKKKEEDARKAEEERKAKEDALREELAKAHAAVAAAGAKGEAPKEAPKAEAPKEAPKAAEPVVVEKVIEKVIERPVVVEKVVETVNTVMVTRCCRRCLCLDDDEWDYDILKARRRFRR